MLNKKERDQSSEIGARTKEKRKTNPIRAINSKIKRSKREKISS